MADDSPFARIASAVIAPSSTGWADALARAANHAPFLAGAMRRHPDLVAQLGQGDLAGALVAVPQMDAQTVASRLRRTRDRLALVVAIGDLAGALPLSEVTRLLSDFADAAVEMAIATAIAERMPGAPPRGFAVIALGKHGGRELNYSSDIDPILLFDPEALPHRERDDPGEAATRIARRIVELLQARDGDGQVFRVDLRLRPAPEVTPIALPVAAAITHYESSALPWERAAFIRARMAAGDQTVGKEFLGAIRPFIWRRSLDFGAIAELRAMTAQIRAHHGARPFGPGYDLKRGRGGIREIEFYVQMHQLIHGGRDPALRSGDTLAALDALRAANWIDAGIAATLTNAYRALRTAEHRLQMVDDRQTHSLPEGEALEEVARLHGLSNGAALLEWLRPHVHAVEAIYDALDPGGAHLLPRDRLPLAAELGVMGFADGEAASRRIEAWRGGVLRSVHSPAAFEALEGALPIVLAAIGTTVDPDEGFRRLDQMLSGLPSALNLFRLLLARPALVSSLVAVLGQAPALAQALAQRPALLDRLVDASALTPAGSVVDLIAEMQCPGFGDPASGAENSIEAHLDQVRHVVGEYRFALGVQIVEGVADPLDAARGYARLAEAAVASIARAVTDEFARVHGRVPGAELVILALGRLGGGVLTHASDLDLIYLFTDPGDPVGESDGPRPLGVTLYFNRLAQRLSAGLSVATSVGALYEVDTRLRPSGAKGPLAVSLSAFARYQAEEAWMWEHMALTRARPIYGSIDARQRARGAISAALTRARDRQTLKAEIAALRADVARHKPPAGPFDVKLAPGGLVDLEFTVHFHQLADAIAIDPDLDVALRALADAGLIDAELIAAHDFLTRLMIVLRLVAPDLNTPPEAVRALVMRATRPEAGEWGRWLEFKAAAQASVARAWMRVIG